MPIETRTRYISPNPGFSLKENPQENVLFHLRDVRTELAKLDPAMASADLMKMLSIVESGEYQVPGGVKVDLGSPQGIMQAYREASEGGCQSCLGKARMPAIWESEGASFHYCKLREDYSDKSANSGESPLVEKHKMCPCEMWKPKLLPRLEELIRATS